MGQEATKLYIIESGQCCRAGGKGRGMGEHQASEAASPALASGPGAVEGLTESLLGRSVYSTSLVALTPLVAYELPRRLFEAHSADKMETPGLRRARAKLSCSLTGSPSAPALASAPTSAAATKAFPFFPCALTNSGSKEQLQAGLEAMQAKFDPPRIRQGRSRDISSSRSTPSLFALRGCTGATFITSVPSLSGDSTSDTAASTTEQGGTLMESTALMVKQGLLASSSSIRPTTTSAWSGHLRQRMCERLSFERGSSNFAAHRAFSGPLVMSKMKHPEYRKQWRPIHSVSSL
ncbi:unnamed protein product [Chrysoparadoxa australica]